VGSGKQCAEELRVRKHFSGVRDQDRKSLIFQTDFAYGGRKLHFNNDAKCRWNSDDTGKKYSTGGGPEQGMFTAKATRE
jgi:hypothetical protein